MDRWDVLCLLGVMLLGVGLGLLAPWLGITAAGVVLLALGVTGAGMTERAERTEQLLKTRDGGG